MEKFFFFLLTVSCVFCQDSTPVQQCDEEKLFKNVAVYTASGLCRTLPCKFRMGENVTAVIQFGNKDVVQQIISMCTAKIFGADVEFSIPEAEKGCDKLVNMKCPVKPNSDIIIKIVLPAKEPVLQIMNNQSGPSIIAKIKFSLHDQSKKMISCFQMSSKVDLI